MPLNAIRLAAGREYLVDHNKSAAAIRAGYKSPYKNLARIYNTELMAWIAEEELKIAQKCNVKAEELIRELRIIAGISPAYTAISKDNKDNDVKTRHITTSDQIRAIDLLGKSLKLWSDISVTVAEQPEGLSKEDLKQLRLMARRATDIRLAGSEASPKPRTETKAGNVA